MTISKQEQKEITRTLILAAGNSYDESVQEAYDLPMFGGHDWGKERGEIMSMIPETIIDETEEEGE